jgi:hypothetical protein
MRRIHHSIKFKEYQLVHYKSVDRGKHIWVISHLFIFVIISILSNYRQDIGIRQYKNYSEASLRNC